MRNLQEFINEGKQIEYRVSLIGCVDDRDLPITVTMLVDPKDQEDFENYLEDEQDNIFAHVEGGNIEF